MITLGFEPQELTVILPTGSGFVATMEADEDWPAGSRIELWFGLWDNTIIWPATVAEELAAWSISDEDVDAVIQAGINDDDYKKARLMYLADGDLNTTPLLWAVGFVSVV